ncbi:FecR family protein [Chitinophaga barathri]|nr:FecR domain-containing protein [Chitinophaga barathri]
MDTQLIRSYLKQMAAGGLDRQQEEWLLQTLGTATEDELLEIYPEAEWQETVPAPVSQRELDRVYTKVTGKRHTPVLHIYIWRAACAAVALLLTGSLYWAYEKQRPATETVNDLARWNTYSTSEGENRVITLADESRIYLNGATTLQIPEQFDKDGRRIRLVKGEAFVVVAHDPTKPFSVEMDAVRVNVLGTSFNMRSYPEEHIATVAVQSGKVAMQLTGTPHELILTPGTMGTFEKKGRLLSMRENRSKHDGWIRKEFYFDDVPLRDVLRRLHYAYGFEFRTDDEHLLDRPVKATFKHMKVNEIVRVLGKMGQFRYTVKDSVVYIRSSQK